MTEERLSAHQLLCMAYVSLLSPAIRVTPRMSARFAGKAAWLCPVAAVAAAVLVGLLLYGYLTVPGPYRGLMQMIPEDLGPVFGRAVLLLYGLWFAFYGGFLLRTSSERLISTAYTQGHLPVFLVLMLAASLIAAAGKLPALGRTAQVLTMLIALVLAFVLMLSLGGFHVNYLLPVTGSDLPGVLLGALPMGDILSVVLMFLFLSDRVAPGGPRPIGRMMALAAASMAAITVPTVACLSAPITQRLQNPFFVMLRNLRVLRSVERIEPLVIGLWIVTDFVFLAALLRMSARTCAGAMNVKKDRPLLALTAPATAAAAVLCGPSAFDMRMLSDRVVPVANAVFSVVIPTFFLLAELLQKRRKTKGVQHLVAKSDAKTPHMHTEK